MINTLTVTDFFSNYLVVALQNKDASSSSDSKRLNTFEALTSVERTSFALEIKKSRTLAMTLVYKDGSTQLRDLPQSKVLEPVF